MIAMDRKELIERLEKLEGANREVNLAIFRHFHPEYDDYVEGRGGLIHPNDSSDMREPADIRWPAYTASLDAAIALVEKVRPGWSWECRASGTGDKGQATIWNPSKQPGRNDEQRAYNCASPAIALLIALLRSLEGEKR
jgi:hypothetical protein